jgi:hypothetical protein
MSGFVAKAFKGFDNFLGYPEWGLGRFEDVSERFFSDWLCVFATEFETQTMMDKGFMRTRIDCNEYKSEFEFAQ